MRLAVGIESGGVKCLRSRFILIHESIKEIEMQVKLEKNRKEYRNRVPTSIDSIVTETCMS